MRSLHRGTSYRARAAWGVALLAGVLTTAARAEDPNGVYAVDSGKLAIKVTSPSVLKGLAALPNLKSLADRTGLKGSMTFLPTPGQEDNFVLTLPPLPLIGALSIPGTWSIPSGTKLSVSMITDAEVQAAAAMLNQLLNRTDVTARITKHGFTGSVQGTQVKAKFALGIVISLPPVSFTISLAGALAGTYTGPVPAGTTLPLATRDFLTEFVVEEVRTFVQ